MSPTCAYVRERKLVCRVVVHTRAPVLVLVSIVPVSLVRVCREAGARVRFNAMLRDMNIGNISNSDGRRIEVVANGLPMHPI